MNYLKDITTLKNRYFVMRHGQSMANVQGLIVSHPENGLQKDYALSEYGKQQAADAAERSGFDSSLVIYTSDFSRARETAEIVKKHTRASELHITPALRERSFGTWEKTDHSNYDEIWKDDVDNADHTENGVESVNHVLARTTQLIKSIEDKYQSRDILLISHGDTLQILQTGFQKVDGAHHRSLNHLETAEIRQLELEKG